MRKNLWLFALVFCILLVGLANAGFELGKLSSGNSTVSGISLESTYGPQGTFAGDLNISLDAESSDSIFSAKFDGADEQTITLLEFLEKFSSDLYNCPLGSCDSAFIASNPEPQKDFSSSQVVGLKITGDVESITANTFLLSVESGALQSCSNPLKIDIFNDGKYEWIAYESTSTFDCPVENDGYGCYNSADKETEGTLILDKNYCNTMEISAFAEIQLGADVKGTDSNIEFLMQISNDNYTGECTFLATGDNTYSCEVPDLRTFHTQIFDVCISPSTVDDANLYKIDLETVDACGYVSDTPDIKRDFSLYAKPAKYAAVGSFILNTDELDSKEPSLGEFTDIEQYIFDNLPTSGCSSGCVIPIKFETNDKILLSDFSMYYEEAGLSPEVTSLYDVSEGVATISTDDYVVFDISKAGFKVPSELGTYALSLELGGEALAIGDVDIEVVDAPVITTVYPQKAPVALNVVFRIFTSGEGVDSYTWNFGDNSSIQTTNTNKLIHQYPSLGTYTLTVSVENSLGKDTRSFDIEVQPPTEYMDTLFDEYQQGLDDVEAELNTYPAWLGSQLKNILDFSNKETELNRLKAEYEAAGGATEEYVDIINSLDDLWIPTGISSKKDETLDFLIDREIMSISNLQTLGAGTPKGLEADIKDSIFGWSLKNIDIRVEKDTYITTHDSASEVVATKFKAKITPTVALDEIYLIIDEQSSNIGFADSSLQTQDVGTATGIVLPSLAAAKEIEFVLPGEIETLEMPLYLSPSFSKLSVIGEIDICDNDGICDSGENSKNCRADCKPWGWVLLWLFILFLIAFIVYVALQEWYKRKYEDYLFPNKNDLYNLVNFIENAEKQKLSKDEMFTKLQAKGWTKEQVIYAWRKYKGLRTGMWEIPVFTFVQKKQVMRHVEMQRRSGVSGKIAPIPKTRPGIVSGKPKPHRFFSNLFKIKSKSNNVKMANPTHHPGHPSSHNPNQSPK